MGIRLEYILILLLIAIIGFTTNIELTSAVSIVNSTNKELEFKDTVFTEVNEKNIQARLFSTRGVRTNGVLNLENIIYFTDKIDLLLSNTGRYNGDILYLDGNVSLQEKEGYLYMAEHANYDKTTNILNITSDFIAIKNKNIFQGKSLVYNTLKKELKATGIDAVIYTSEK